MVPSGKDNLEPMSEKRSSIEYLSNEEIWFDPSCKIHSLGGEEIRSLRDRKIEVQNRLRKGSEEHGHFACQSRQRDIQDLANALWEFYFQRF
jgi:hypothetical protein